MIPETLREKLTSRISQAENPREQSINVMYEVQRHYGYLTDEGLNEAAALVGATPLELEELATFYDFIYREPVGRFVLHVCDGVVCWMFHEGSLFDYMCQKLGVCAGEVYRRRPVHRAAHRLHRLLRPGPGHGGQRAVFRPSHPGSGSTRSWSN